VTLLLPLDAPEFQPAAEAVQRGFLAAMAAEGRTLEVVTRRTDASDERVLADYDAAIQAGTRLVVGPMTRSGVAALARTNRLAVPTLALNQPEGSVAVPSSLFVFGLAVETEARQSARRAWTDGQRPTRPWSRRSWTGIPRISFSSPTAASVRASSARTSAARCRCTRPRR
jgi:hypothetical protein